MWHKTFNQCHKTPRRVTKTIHKDQMLVGIRYLQLSSASVLPIQPASTTLHNMCAICICLVSVMIIIYGKWPRREVIPPMSLMLLKTVFEQKSSKPSINIISLTSTRYNNVENFLWLLELDQLPTSRPNSHRTVTCKLTHLFLTGALFDLCDSTYSAFSAIIAQDEFIYLSKCGYSRPT